jgi:transcription initiation factor TFIIB
MNKTGSYIEEEREKPLLVTEGDVQLRETTFHKKKEGGKSEKTKKKKVQMNVDEKQKLWETFDKLKFSKTNKIECIYLNDEDNEICTVCNSNLITMEDGFPTCTNKNCSVVYTNVLDYSPEWRYFGADDKNANDPTRCGNPINPLLSESSFGCKVLSTQKCSYEMKKIRKWTEWQAMPHKEKSLYEEFQFITVMAQNAGINKIFIDEAMNIHKDISEQKIFRGLNRDGIKAASIYISCRQNGCPRTAHEIAEIFKLDRASATNGCSMAMNILNGTNNQGNNLELTTPVDFIQRYCSKLNFPSKLVMLAVFIANKITNGNVIVDNAPHSIAAGIIYFISNNCNLNITKTDIKLICGVSEVTINKCFKKMENIKAQLIPQSIIDEYVLQK